MGALACAILRICVGGSPAMPMPFSLRNKSAQSLRSAGVVATLGIFLSGQLIPSQAFAGPSRTALLGLDAADSNAGREISDAIADSLEARNALFRAPLTFAEFRLMMSCSPENNRCLGRAGEGFDAPQMMLGGLVHSGDEIQVDLRLLRNRTGAMLASKRFVFKPDHLKGEQLMTSADYMVNTLFAQADGQPEPKFPFAPVISPNQVNSDAPPAPPTDQASEPAPAPAERENLPTLSTPAPSREVLKDEPAPPRLRDHGRSSSGVGNKVGLGVSAGLAVASFGAALWTHQRLGSDGPIRKEILNLAAASVSETDNDPGNDIHPTRPDNLCDIARRPRETDASQIRNEDIAAVCDRGERLVAINTASLIAGGVFTVSTAVFLGLVIRDAKAKKRKVSFNGSWTPGLGGHLSTRFRF